jgi:hypothetical protein
VNRRSRTGPLSVRPGTVPDLALSAGGGGLVVGRDRWDVAMVLRPMRPEPTNVVMVGGLACAHLLVLRLVAVGARVAVQTVRQGDWQVFVQRSGIGPNYLIFMPPGVRRPPTATARRPEVIVVDVGPVTWTNVSPAGSWQTTMVVRHELAQPDTDLLGSADLVLMQQLTEPEATIAAAAVGMPNVEQWLPRISPTMISTVSQGRVQWATLSPSDLETRVLGPVARW